MMISLSALRSMRLLGDRDVTGDTMTALRVYDIKDDVLSSTI